MIVIPLQVSETAYSIIVLLEDDNLERIKAYDPAEITIRKLGLSHLRLQDVVIGYATAQEAAQVAAIRDRAEIPELLKKLSRGYQYRPDKGDHDGPYLSLKVEGRTQ